MSDTAVQARPMPRFKTLYNDQIKAQLQSDLGLGNVMEVGRTGTRIHTPIPYEVGKKVHLQLGYRGDLVELEGTVRWCRQAEVGETRDALASYDVGIAFSRVGEVAADSLWRTLAVYVDDRTVTCMKRFKFGGTIMNKDYSLATPNAKVLLFDDKQPEAVYVKYAPAKGQRIHQQVFKTSKVAVKGVKAKGVQLTVKKIKTIGTKPPRNWDDDAVGNRGAMIDL